MKRFFLLTASVLFLASCGQDTDSDSSSSTVESPMSNSSKVEAESNAGFVKFTSGLANNNEVHGDSRNYANVSGETSSAKTLYIVDGESGLVHGIQVPESGKFDFSINMQGVDERELIVTNDDLEGLIVDDVDSIVNKVVLNYIPNPNAEDSSSQSKDNSEVPSYTDSLPYALNEPVGLVFGDSVEVVAEVVVTKVTDNIEFFPDYIKNGDYFDATKLILVRIEYTNISYPENLSFGLHDFQVFNESGKLLPDISQQNGGDPVAQGRTGTAEFYLEVEEPLDKVEIDFVPQGSTSPIATYAIDVEH